MKNVGLKFEAQLIKYKIIKLLESTTDRGNCVSELLVKITLSDKHICNFAGAFFFLCSEMIYSFSLHYSTYWQQYLLYTRCLRDDCWVKSDDVIFSQYGHFLLSNSVSNKRTKEGWHWHLMSVPFFVAVVT